ncbi:MAG: MmgE/PrpD family protein [Ruminococcaceae bacterium]|nr:MmgE/PrpD family protein [Oscillospiraceae bacterium]
MHFETTYKLENFILDTQWKDVPEEVKQRMKGCFVDLMGALVIGSRSRQFEAGVKLAETIFGEGDIPVVGSAKKFNFLGASTAMGHSSNAYDIDDGHNMTRAHPGTSFVGAVLAAAYENNLSRDEFLTAMLVAYETTIRIGAAIMDYYQYAHSSGTFGAVGVAAGVGRILGFTKEEMNNVLSVAEFNAPLVPGIRSVEYPSMNKDGVPFGVMTGILAVKASQCGFVGNKNLLESDEHKHYLDDLNTKWQVMDLYFKPYTCCRWAHPAIDACVGLMKENGITADDIESAAIRTFHRATLLSKIVPQSADEAQYNIAYPVAAALVHGDFGLAQVREENLGDPKVLEMMKRLSFVVDEKLDAQFPARRICRAEIVTKDGRTFLSDECEPRGEAYENISVDWLADKFRRITGPVLTAQAQEKLLDMITGEENVSVRAIVDEVNKPEYWLY